MVTDQTGKILGENNLGEITGDITMRYFYSPRAC